MKNFKLMAVALMAMVGLNSCSNDQEFIEVDHSQDLVGTWTCLEENFAQAFIFNADGTALTMGVENGAYWEDVEVAWKVENNKLTLSYGENVTEALLEIVSGEMLAISDKDGSRRHVFQYCKEDLADEIVGMWVCTEEVFGQDEESVGINTYTKDGKSYLTAFLPDADGYLTQMESDYKVVGNLLIGWTKGGPDATSSYLVLGLDYMPNGTELGDIMTFYNPVYGTRPTFLRIRQSLNLANKNYDYSNIYVTNVKGEDKEFEFAGQTLNFATLDGKIMDKLMRHILFNVSFDAEKISYNCYFNGENKSIDAPIAVDGNKVTIKMSENNSVYRDIEVYMFQDQDNTQMHMYMPATSFEKFYGNVSAAALAKEGKLDLSDAEAVAQIYASIEEAIETINLSFIFKDSTRAL